MVFTNLMTTLRKQAQVKCFNKGLYLNLFVPLYLHSDIYFTRYYGHNGHILLVVNLLARVKLFLACFNECEMDTYI